MRRSSSVPILVILILTLAHGSSAQAQWAVEAAIAVRRDDPRALSDSALAMSRYSASSPSTDPHRTATFVLVGAGAGAVAGAVIGAISMHDHPPHADGWPSDAGTGIALSGLFGAGVGALTGWLVAVLTR